MPWTPPQSLLDALLSKRSITLSVFKDWFGPVSNSDIDLYPNSLAAKLSYLDDTDTYIPGAVGLQANDFTEIVAMDADLDIQGNLISTNTDGVLTGMIDVTVYGVTMVESDYPSDAVMEANYTKIVEAIEAAVASDDNKIVWFPADGDKTVLWFKCPAGVHGLPIHPNLIYKSARNVTLRRYMDASDSDVTAAIFTTTLAGGGTASFAGSAVVFDGFRMVATGYNSGTAGISGIYMSPSGGSVVDCTLIVRNCTIEDCRSTTVARYGVYSYLISSTTVKFCSFLDCDNGAVAGLGNRLFLGNRFVRGSGVGRVGVGFGFLNQVMTAYGMSVMANCNCSGPVGSGVAHTSYSLVSVPSPETLIGCTTAVHGEGSGGTIIGVLVAGFRASVIQCVVAPDLRKAARNVDYGISVTGKWNCISGNIIGSTASRSWTIKILKGIYSYTTEDKGNNHIDGNIISGNVTLALATNGRYRTNPTLDARADMCQYDYEKTGVCAYTDMSAWPSFNPQEEPQPSSPGLLSKPMGHGLGKLTGTYPGVRTFHVSDAATGSRRILAGGAFGSSGAAEINNIAVWDRSLWRSFHGRGLNGAVNCIAEVGDRIYIGGSFNAKYGETAGTLPALAYTDDFGVTLQLISDSDSVVGKPFQGFYRTNQSTTGLVYSVVEWGEYLVICGSFQYLKFGASSSTWVRCNNVALYHIGTSKFVITGMDVGCGVADTESVTTAVPITPGEVALFGQFQNIGAYPNPSNGGYCNTARMLNVGGTISFAPLAPYWFMNPSDSIDSALYVGGVFVVSGLVTGMISYVRYGVPGSTSQFQGNSVFSLGRNNVTTAQGHHDSWGPRGDSGNPRLLRDVDHYYSTHSDVFYLTDATDSGNYQVYSLLAREVGGGDDLQVLLGTDGGILTARVKPSSWQLISGIVLYRNVAHQPVPNYQSYSVKALAQVGDVTLAGGDFGMGIKQTTGEYMQRAYGMNMNMVG